MPRTRRSASGLPWGRSPRWVTLALTKSMAEPFGQAAAQAPQPMQAAASMALSAMVFEIGTELASGADPLRSLM